MEEDLGAATGPGGEDPEAAGQAGRRAQLPARARLQGLLLRPADRRRI